MKRTKTTSREVPPKKTGCLPLVLLLVIVCTIVMMGKNTLRKNVDYFLRGEADIGAFFREVSYSYQKHLTYPDFQVPLDGGITSPFGERINPLTNETEIHTGIDIDLSMGSEVRAAADGTIVKTATDERFGNYILIEHAGGFTTCYAHLAEWKRLAGDTVSKGDIIAVAGDSGNTTGAHLHFEIRRGEERVNPSLYLKH